MTRRQRRAGSSPFQPRRLGPALEWSAAALMGSAGAEVVGIGFQASAVTASVPDPARCDAIALLTQCAATSTESWPEAFFDGIGSLSLTFGVVVALLLHGLGRAIGASSPGRDWLRIAVCAFGIAVLALVAIGAIREAVVGGGHRVDAVVGAIVAVAIFGAGVALATARFGINRPVPVARPDASEPSGR